MPQKHKNYIQVGVGQIQATGRPEHQISTFDSHVGTPIRARQTLGPRRSWSERGSRSVRIWEADAHIPGPDSTGHQLRPVRVQQPSTNSLWEGAGIYTIIIHINVVVYCMILVQQTHKQKNVCKVIETDPPCQKYWL